MVANTAFHTPELRVFESLPMAENEYYFSGLETQCPTGGAGVLVACVRFWLQNVVEAQVQKTTELEDAMAQANLLLQERKHFLLTSESVQVQELASMQEAIAQATHDAETVRSELDKVLEEKTGLRGSLKRATADLEATQKEMDAMRVESENEKEVLKKQHAHRLEKWAQELFQAQEHLMQALEEASMIREQLNCQLQIYKELEDAKTQQRLLFIGMGCSLLVRCLVL